VVPARKDGMGQAVSVITAGVADVDRARRFYLEGLGWKAALDLPEIVFVQVNHGLLLALWGRAELVADLGLPPASATSTAEPNSAMTLSQNVGSPAEVDAVVAEFVSAGGTVVKPPQQAAFGGYHGAVADLDGLIWEIAYNPGLTVADDGTVRIVPIE
jgi:catechol 2,3-dioxygenase-like lactoylglutathione lyase family enzyme